MRYKQLEVDEYERVKEEIVARLDGSMLKNKTSGSIMKGPPPKTTFDEQRPIGENDEIFTMVQGEITPAADADNHLKIVEQSSEIDLFANYEEAEEMT